MAQSVKHPALDFHSSRVLTACEFETLVGLCADSAEPARDSCSLTLCPSPHHSLSVSQINKLRVAARWLSQLSVSFHLRS